MSERQRPHICPNPKCEMLWTNFRREKFDQGYSFDCWCKMPVPNSIASPDGGAIHTNDLFNCTWTPFKGLTRFLKNVGDIRRELIAVGKLLDKLRPLECDECGPVNRMDGSSTQYGDGPRLCDKCAVRLGKMRWNGKYKRYW